MAAKIETVELVPQSVKVGDSFAVKVKASLVTWQDIKNKFTAWNNLKSGLSTWGAVEKYKI